MGQCKAYERKYTVKSFQYPCRRWVCLHAQRLDRSIDDFCADNHNYFQFKLKGKRRSAGSATAQVQVCDSTLLRWSMSLLCSSTGAVHGVTE